MGKLGSVGFALAGGRLYGGRVLSPSAKQANQQIQRGPVATVGTAAELAGAALFEQDPIQPAPGMHIVVGPTGQLGQQAGLRQKIHVPEVRVVPVMVRAVTLGIPADKGDRRGPVAARFGRR